MLLVGILIYHLFPYSFPFTTHHCHPKCASPNGYILDLCTSDWFWNIVISIHEVHGVSLGLCQTSGYYLLCQVDRKTGKERSEHRLFRRHSENWTFFGFTCFRDELLVFGGVIYWLVLGVKPIKILNVVIIYIFT